MILIYSLYISKLHVGHFSQIQQGSGTDVLKSLNYYHLIVSMREAFPENFSFIAQLSLTLWLLKFYRLSKNFHFANFFDFQKLLLSDSFYC